MAALAGAHQERLDGSGYHRGSTAAQLPTAARLLAAADVWAALGEDRPHRPAFGLAAARDTLCAEASAGRLDPDAVDAVLAGRRPGRAAGSGAATGGPVRAGG